MRMCTSRRRRCCICRALFRPDPRVGSRQKTCGQPSCQKARHAERQALWRRRNRDYYTDRRFRHRLRQAELAHRFVRGGEATVRVRAPPVPRLPRGWSCLPWDLVQDELGVLTADVLALVIRLLTSHLCSLRGVFGEDTS